MIIKANDTFWQRRKIRGMQPILLEVLEVEEVIGTRNICKVRWHILGKDSVSTSVFPMMAITEGHFADFVPIPRELFLKAMDILNTTSIEYPTRKRKILRLMKEYQYIPAKTASPKSRSSRPSASSPGNSSRTSTPSPPPESGRRLFLSLR